MNTSPSPARRPLPPSIRRRLSRLLIGVALAWGLAVSIAVWLAQAHEVDELLDDTLRDSAEVLVALLEPGLPALAAANGSNALQRSAAPNGPAAEHFAWQLVGPRGEVVLRSPRAPATPFLPLPLAGFSNAVEWRVFGLNFRRGDHLLYVAQTREERHEAQAEVALVSALAALAVGLVTAGWLRSRIRYELEPLAASTEALQQYSPLHADAALAPAQRAELVPMHAAVEDLGHRLAQRVANERAFSAHAAHALRTPLAGIDAQLAVALRECPPALVARLERVRQAAGRLTRVVDALLALFRSGVEPQWQAVELAPLLARLPIEGLALHVDPTAVVRADADLLTAALLNLLDNALRHGATTLDVRVVHAPGTDGDACVLRLHDNGRGIAEERRVALQRAIDQQDYEAATGLGLMLADLVARAHGGSLHLLPAATGCVVEMRLGTPIVP